MSARVGIVLVNYHAFDELAVALESLRTLTYRDVDIVVVDNEAAGDEITISERFPEVTVLAQVANLGFAGGCNVGIRHVLNGGADHVLLLNIDAVVSPGLLEPMVHALASDPTIGACGPVMVDWETGATVEFAGVGMDYKGIGAAMGAGSPIGDLPTAPFDVPYLHGSAMMMPRAALDASGGLDERYFLNYEDIDLCERLREDGWRIVIVPGATYRHKGNVTIGRSSPLGHYYLMRNRFLFLADHRRWRMLAPALLAAIVNGRRDKDPVFRTVNRRAVADFRRGRFGRRPIGVEDDTTTS